MVLTADALCPVGGPPWIGLVPALIRIGRPGQRLEPFVMFLRLSLSTVVALSFFSRYQSVLFFVAWRGVMFC